MFSGINSIIALMKNPVPISLIRNTRAAPVKGRASLPLSTVIEITDCVHHPESTQQNKQSRGVSSNDRIAVYLRTEILTNTEEENDAYNLIINGKIYEVVETENWNAGGFWVAKAEEIFGHKHAGFIYAKPLTSTQSTSPSPAMRFENIKRGVCGMSSQRQFRFDIEDLGGTSVVGISFPIALVQQSDSVQYRAINSSGVAQTIVPNSTVNSADYTVVMLPKIIANDGRLKYEVF